MSTILKSGKEHKYLSLGPTKILQIVPFYLSFKPHLDAARCHQKAVNGVLKFKPPYHSTDMDYGTFRFKLKPPPLENPGSSPATSNIYHKVNYTNSFFFVHISLIEHSHFFLYLS